MDVTLAQLTILAQTVDVSYDLWHCYKQLYDLWHYPEQVYSFWHLLEHHNDLDIITSCVLTHVIVTRCIMAETSRVL